MIGWENDPMAEMLLTSDSFLDKFLILGTLFGFLI